MRVALSLLLAVVVTACAGAAPTGGGEGHDRDRAIAVARELGQREGYAPSEYQLESAERVADGAHAGRWHVLFVHVPPAPPGGHFGVYVDPATWEGELIHGR